MKSILKGRQAHFFTLLEIVICIAILGAASLTMGWQLKNMLDAHYFQKGMNQLVTDLHKGQLIALSDRVDIEALIYKEAGEYFYQLKSDSMVPLFNNKPYKLRGLKTTKQNHQLKDAITLTIFSSGRIAEASTIEFFQDEERKIVLNLEKPLLIVKKP